MTLYMVIEHYRHGAAPVYERFAASGRMLPEGLDFVESWVVDEPEITTCYQLMRTADEALLLEWMSRWGDLIVFEHRPLIDSAEAAARSS